MGQKIENGSSRNESRNKVQSDVDVELNVELKTKWRDGRNRCSVNRK